MKNYNSSVAALTGGVFGGITGFIGAAVTGNGAAAVAEITVRQMLGESAVYVASEYVSPIVNNQVGGGRALLSHCLGGVVGYSSRFFIGSSLSFGNFAASMLLGPPVAIGLMVCANYLIEQYEKCRSKNTQSTSQPVPLKFR